MGSYRGFISDSICNQHFEKKNAANEMALVTITALTSKTQVGARSLNTHLMHKGSLGKKKKKLK